MMTRFVGAILIAATISMSALAQQKEQPTSSTGNKAKETASPAQRMRDAFSKLDPLSASSRLPVFEINYVLRDGKLYMDFGELSIPVPGGGASGCFTRDLSERIEKLKIVIEALRNIR